MAKKPTPGIKVQYLREGQYPIVEGTRCVEVRIPDHDAYLPVLAGFVALAMKYFNYLRLDKTKASQVAHLWKKAYDETEWMACMNCEELTECITPLLEAQTIQITNNILNQLTYGSQNPGVPLSGGQGAANIAGSTNPMCDQDILWAQCLAIIQSTNAAIVDVLQKIEAATNVVELAGLSGEIPLVGWILEAFGEELATDTINYFQEALEQEYNAQYTTEVEYALACQLFCMASGNCVLSVDNVWGIFQSNLEEIIPETPGDLVDLIEIVAGVDFDGTEVVNICFYFAWGALRLGQFFFGKPVTQAAFQLMVGLAVNDANDDWTLLCDCPEIWTHVLNSADDPAILVIPDDTVGTISGEVISQTTGVTFGQDIAGIQVKVVFPDVQEILLVKVEATDVTNVPDEGLVNHFIAYRDSGGGNISGAGAALPDTNGDWEVRATGTFAGVKTVAIQYVYLGTLMTADFKVTISGRGINPFL